jgi:hypothetical protein
LLEDETIKAKLSEFIKSIKAYSGNGTYFVRKISAQALLPLIKFSEYIPEVQETLRTLIDKAPTLRQN